MASAGKRDIKNLGVSVVIPTLNEESNIADAIRHILAQTWRPCEIIVVDNGSSDHTVQIACAFPEVTVVCQNLPGVGNARNMGAHQSRQDIVWFVDADCRPGEKHLEKALKVFTDESVGLVTGPADYERKHLMVLQLMYATSVKVIGKMFRGATAVGANVFVWKESFLAIGGFDARSECMLEDVALAIAMVRDAHKKVVYKKDLTMPTSRRRLDKDGVLWHMFTLGLGTIGLFFGLKPCPRFEKHVRS
ncbi:MAG: glycosyltransferase family 2 protein [Candidatus Pacebacteria bacterium]|nr:glycosyltransferase family 2 protein [Candidatus Paceibacterota bacterium]